MSWRVEPKVEPEIDATPRPTSDSVREAMMELARRTAGGHVALVVICVLGAVVALVPSLRNVGARAPVDLRYLCVVIAFAIGGVMAFLARRRTTAFLARVTAQDLIGVTPNLDKSLWLHFRNGRTLRTPAGNFDLALIEATLPKRPAPPKLRPAALFAWVAFLAPLGVGLWLNYVPIPVQISQIESNGGRLQLTGTAVLIDGAFVKKGNAEYGTIWLTDGSGHCRVLVKADQIPGTERFRHEPGLLVRVVVHSENVRYEGQLMEKIDVLIADSFESER